MTSRERGSFRRIFRKGESIAPETERLTIVNGKRLAEGEWLVVETALGVASVRVISIQDGLVRFRHGGESIDAKLQPLPEKKPQ